MQKVWGSIVLTENKDCNHEFIITDAGKFCPNCGWFEGNTSLQREAVLKAVEELMKKYNITKDKMVADYPTLKYLFLKGESQDDN